MVRPAPGGTPHPVFPPISEQQQPGGQLAHVAPGGNVEVVLQSQVEVVVDVVELVLAHGQPVVVVLQFDGLQVVVAPAAVVVVSHAQVVVVQAWLFGLCIWPACDAQGE